MYVPLSKTGLSLQWLFTQCSAVSHLSKTGLLHLIRVTYLPLSETGLLFQWLLMQCSVSPLSKTGLLFQWLFTQCSVSPLSKTGLLFQWLFTQCSVSPLSKTGLLFQWLFTQCSVSPLSKTGLLFQWLFTQCSVSPLSKTGLFSFVCLISPKRCPWGKLCLTSMSLLSFVKICFNSYSFFSDCSLRDRCVISPFFFTHGGLILINILSKKCLVWKKSLIAHFLLSSCEISPCNGTKSDLYVHVSQWLFSKKQL